MKEIVYIQAGRFSNYTGTHFWNAQESYLTSDDGEPRVDSSISFCEGIDEQVRADSEFLSLLDMIC
jgi:hypothetical protein